MILIKRETTNITGIFLFSIVKVLENWLGARSICQAGFTANEPCQNLHLVIAAFRGVDQAETALAQLPEADKNYPTVVVLIKDEDGHVTFKDVGKTPGKQAVKGAVLGAVVGVLTGGAGLALGALGGLAAHRSASKKQVEKVASLQLNQVAASMGSDSSAIVGIGHAPLKESTLRAL